ncbi:hypothetical protein LTR04_001494 [Oleoguttula sp. CCFEE 6159]|nr:hypothetical protein LTR04_001494 [Oleoguttula sp. CCFEE 6159]
MAPKLEHAFTMRGYISKENSMDLGAMKQGPTRIIVPISHGFVRGSGLEATIAPGGGDWILFDSTTNYFHLDVRTQARTKDGDSVYIHYTGILGMDEAAKKVLGWSKDAKTTSYGDHQWFTGPIMEMSSADFKWVETTLFVGQGHFVVEGEAVSAVEYEIYKVVN